MLAAQHRTRKKGDRQMEAKPAQQNIQDSFLNTARKERHNITIYLVSGVKLTGRIRAFDKYSVVLETSNQEQLIFKHAISTIVISRAAHSHIDSKPTAVPSLGEVSIPSPRWPHWKDKFCDDHSWCAGGSRSCHQRGRIVVVLVLVVILISADRF